MRKYKKIFWWFILHSPYYTLMERGISYFSFAEKRNINLIKWTCTIYFILKSKEKRNIKLCVCRNCVVLNVRREEFLFYLLFSKLKWSAIIFLFYFEMWSEREIDCACDFVQKEKRNPNSARERWYIKIYFISQLHRAELYMYS